LIHLIHLPTLKRPLQPWWERLEDLPRLFYRLLLLGVGSIRLFGWNRNVDLGVGVYGVQLNLLYARAFRLRVLSTFFENLGSACLNAVVCRVYIVVEHLACLVVLHLDALEEELNALSTA